MKTCLIRMNVLLLALLLSLPGKGQCGFVYHDCWNWYPGATNIATDMTIDSSGYIWVCSGNLIRHQVAGGGWSSILAPNPIHQMEFDDLGRLWVYCTDAAGITGTGYTYDGSTFVQQFTTNISDATNDVFYRAPDGAFWRGACRYVGGVLDSCLSCCPIQGSCYTFRPGPGYDFYRHVGCMNCMNLCSDLNSNVYGFNANTDLIFCDYQQYPYWGGNQISVDPQSRFWAFHTYTGSATWGSTNPCTSTCISRFANGSWLYITDVNGVLDDDLMNDLLWSLSGIGWPSPARPGYDLLGNGWGAYHHLFMIDTAGNTNLIPNSNHCMPLTREVLLDQNQVKWFSGVWDSAGTLHYGLISYQQPGCNVQTYNVPAHICQGSSYLLGNTVLTTDGYYEDTLTNIYGCDSIVHLTLSVHSPVSNTQQQTICANESYDFYGTTLNTTGTYSHNLTTQYGCDSTVILNLSVLPAPNTVIHQSICTNETFSFFGNTLDSTGTYTHNLAATNGCDSIITLHLSVVNQWSDTTYATICNNETYPFFGANLNTQGWWYQYIPNPTACDSVYFLHLTVLPTHSQTTTAQICVGESFNFNGAILTTSGSYFDTLVSTTGCDSAVLLNLAVYLPTFYTLNASIVQGGTYTFNGQQLSQPGSYYDTLTNAEGCDSIIELELSVLPGIPENKDKNGLYVWPNPAQEQLTVHCLQCTKAEVLEVLDATGRVVHRQRMHSSNTQLSTGHYPAGLYLLRLGTATARFLKE